MTKLQNCRQIHKTHKKTTKQNTHTHTHKTKKQTKKKQKKKKNNNKKHTHTQKKKKKKKKKKSEPDRKKHHELPKTKEILFCWLPSHVGIRGNEAAEVKAKASLDLDISNIKHVRILNLISTGTSYPNGRCHGTERHSINCMK